MCGTIRRDYPIFRKWILAMVVLAGGYAIARYWPSSLWPSLRALRDLCGAESSSATSATKASEPDEAKTTRDQLRQRVIVLLNQRREVTGQLRLLEATSMLAPALGRTAIEGTKGRLWYEMQVYAQQLVAIESRIETTRRLLQRLDALILQLQCDATSERADRDVLRQAAELLWEYDPGRSGPNARIPDWDWESETAAGDR